MTHIKKKISLIGFVFLSLTAQAIEVNFNPLSILTGATTADVLIEVDKNIKFGPSVGFMNLGLTTVNVRAFDIGARGEYAFNGFKDDGAYFAGRLYYSNVNINVQDGLLSCTTNSATGVLLGGHAWRFNNGFSIKLGAGFKQIVVMDEGISCEVNGMSVVPDTIESSSQFKLAYEAGISWSF
ncbi:MAG: hypothetical protein HRU38_02360 [Saccharospirillaceae bacterium]|nr:hypothetical protein [Pseudomonadales bacterium]NRB77503.1 hypothetical protein [Saccharospirillaceae bacterium]